MHDDQASATALWVARQRAAHQLLDRPLVFADPVAVPILGHDEASEICENAAEYRSPFNLGFRSAVVARSRYSDDVLTAALERGIRQIVILGAGLDTVGYRRQLPPGATVIEIDHPATQAWKQQRLADAGIAIPSAVRFLPIDFADAALVDALTGGDIDPSQPIWFSWLGVTYYLRPETVTATITQIGSLPPGSEIVFDYFEPPHHDPATEPPGFSDLRTDVAGAGEPWTCHFTPADIADLVTGAGFDTFHDQSSDQLSARYFTGRDDGLALTGPLHCARATRSVVTD